MSSQNERLRIPTDSEIGLRVSCAASMAVAGSIHTALSLLSLLFYRALIRHGPEKALELLWQKNNVNGFEHSSAASSRSFILAYRAHNVRGPAFNGWIPQRSAMN